MLFLHNEITNINTIFIHITHYHLFPQKHSVRSEKCSYDVVYKSLCKCKAIEIARLLEYFCDVFTCRGLLVIFAVNKEFWIKNFAKNI